VSIPQQARFGAIHCRVRRALALTSAIVSVLCLPSAAAAQYDLPTRAPNLRVTVIRPSEKALTAGVRYTWRIRVRNSGDATARRISVRVRFEGLTAVKGGKVSMKLSRSTFTLRRLFRGKTKVFRLSGVVAPTAEKVSVRASATWAD
jgi:hypothetical protein